MCACCGVECYLDALYVDWPHSSHPHMDSWSEVYIPISLYLASSAVASSTRMSYSPPPNTTLATDDCAARAASLRLSRCICPILCWRPV